ncbi:MAG: hypothetical protein M3Q08_11355 [Pseudomonadota bacterium]|nr:hypothetical protein [Pseudomonadota bacterium]
MVLIRLILALLLAATALAPAAAHKDHQKKMAEAAAAAKAAEEAGQMPANAVVAHPMSPVVHEAVKEDLAALEAEAARPWHARLIDWLGRTHPFLVHFPLALFPVACVALILARRRGDAVDVIRSLIVVGGAAAAAAALLGWFNAGFELSDKDPLLGWHRWMGTALGLVGAAIAFWAWRRASSVNSRAMVVLLGLVTVALLVQGWLGGALIHGIDHLNW